MIRGNLVMNKYMLEMSRCAVPAPVGGQNSRRGPKLPPGRDLRTWLVAVPLVLIVIAAFIPALDNGFVNWDDDKNFLDNPFYRGLGGAQVKWAWSTFWLGVYQPLAWLLFEVQYVCLETRPAWLPPDQPHPPRRQRCRPVCLDGDLARPMPARFVAQESVDVLRWARGWRPPCSRCTRCESRPWPGPPASRICPVPCSRCWRFSPISAHSGWVPPRGGVGSWARSSLFVAALLSHAVAVSLPVVLLILDVYPLRRFGDGPGRWFGSAARRAWWEKVPFVMVSLVFMGVAIAARRQALVSTEQNDASASLAQACYGIWFYILKTVLPLDLVAVYPSPREIDWLAPPFLLSILGTLAMSVGLFLLRRRWPGLLAAWLSYLVILAPNLGIIRISDQIAADRYSYLAMLGWVIWRPPVFAGSGRGHRGRDRVPSGSSRWAWERSWSWSP